jgi:hypothetical protein
MDHETYRIIPQTVVDMLDEQRMKLHTIADGSGELLTAMKIRDVTSHIWGFTHRNWPTYLSDGGKTDD